MIMFAQGLPGFEPGPGKFKLGRTPGYQLPAESSSPSVPASESGRANLPVDLPADHWPS